MNAKPLKLLLLEDRRKDARFLQKAIKDGGSFDCKLSKWICWRKHFPR